MTIVSPSWPTRPSTLIFSFRNFSKAEMSKILSLTGCEALMTNFLVVLPDLPDLPAFF